MAATDLADRCRQNLAAVRDRIATACRTAGRDSGDVRLVGVTKYVSAELTRMLLAAGCHDLAESRPQSLWAKAAALADHEPAPRWHLIGHLQRNKLRRTLPLMSLLHSLDSVRLLEAIEAEAAGSRRCVLARGAAGSQVRHTLVRASEAAGSRSGAWTGGDSAPRA